MECFFALLEIVRFLLVETLSSVVLTLIYNGDYTLGFSTEMPFNGVRIDQNVSAKSLLNACTREDWGCALFRDRAYSLYGEIKVNTF